MTIETARTVIDTEITALEALRDRINGSFLAALDAILACSGHVAVIGVGKAGLVGRKISATLASTGTPSFFLHPAEAQHGDLGMLKRGDVGLLLSNSGESEEIIRLLPHIRRMGVLGIAVTGDERSTLATQSDILLPLGNIREACPMGLAPTATTTAMLALGDALAVCLMRRRNFKESDYAGLHPAGSLGKKVMPVENVMRVGDAMAKVGPDDTVMTTMLAITKARAGAAVVVDGSGMVAGIFCDGDLRRGLMKGGSVFLDRPVKEVMIRDCARVRAGTLAREALDLMRERRISEVPVVDASGIAVGMVDMKGLLATL